MPNRSSEQDIRALDEEELKAKLEPFCGPIDRARLAELTRDHDSAEDLAKEILARRNRRRDYESAELLWFSIMTLWERWQPERPSLEMINDWMEGGYELSDSVKPTEACDLWLRVWNACTEICEKHHIDTVHAFDRRWRGTQSMFNWMQDLEMELWNAGMKDPSYLHKRIEYCRDVLARFNDLGALTVQNFRSAIGESLVEIGEEQTADTEFESLTSANPTDGTLWGRWAHSFVRSDPQKAVDILARGLAAPEVSDRSELLGLAIEIGEEAGRTELVEKWRNELDLLENPPPEVPFRREAKKVGRNDPCPCGSGRKYKKCCFGSGTEGSTIESE